MLIFSLIAASIVAIFVSVANAYQKAKAITFVKDNADLTLSKMAKNVRMGKIISGDGSWQNYLIVQRNKDQVLVCYKFTDDHTLSVFNNLNKDTPTDCLSGDSGRVLLDLGNTQMTFGSNSGFYARMTDSQVRGSAEINLEINSNTEQEMSADKIEVQTTVSSRDYGWLEMSQ